MNLFTPSAILLNLLATMHFVDPRCRFPWWIIVSSKLTTHLPSWRVDRPTANREMFHQQFPTLSFSTSRRILSLQGHPWGLQGHCKYRQNETKYHAAQHYLSNNFSRTSHACGMIKDSETHADIAIVAGGRDSDNEHLAGSEYLTSSFDRWIHGLPLPKVGFCIAKTRQ